MLRLSESIVCSRKLNQLRVNARWLFMIMLTKRGLDDVEFELSYTRITQITGFARTTIWRGIKELEKADLITYDRGGLEQHANRYRINQAWLDYGAKHELGSGVKLKSSATPRRTATWKKLRWQVLSRDEFKCTKCGETKALVAHHLTYERAGHELLEDLVTLCTECHHKEPRLED